MQLPASDHAAAELALWEGALREQRDAEAALEQARANGPRQRIFELLPQVEALRTRADLLLAEAVKAKCAYRDRDMAVRAPSRALTGRPDHRGT